jgi:uncharacterized protein DUF6766
MARRRWIRDHGLALALFAAFVIFLLAQSLTGWSAHNEDLADHGRTSISYTTYLTTGHFVEATFENWESEFLQMAAYVVLTIWLVQRGSSESKPLEGDEELEADPRAAADAGDLPGPVRRGGWELRLYENSLGLVFAGLFLASFTLHALGGVNEYNMELMDHGVAPVSLGRFMTTSTFWFQSFQNWQSEFLAVGLLVTLSVFLRQRGSPESKPVAAPHRETGS